MEMCFIGKIDYTAGIYCLVASFTGYFTSLALGTEYEANVIASVPAMTPRTVVIVVISAHHLRPDGTPLCVVGSNRQEPVRSLYHQLPRSRTYRRTRGFGRLCPPRRLGLRRPFHVAFRRWICRQHHPGGRSHQVGRHSAYPGCRLPRRRGHALCLASVRHSAAGSVVSPGSTPVFWRLSACSASSAPASTCPSLPV